MTLKQNLSIGIVAIAIIGVVLLALGGFGKNNEQNWQIIQGVRGKITIRDIGGWYLRKFATVTTYPRFMDLRYNNDPREGDEIDGRIKTTFVDGGTADHGVYIRIGTPINFEHRRFFHQQFAGSIPNIKAAVKAHLTNCMKATAPLMSGSEHQSARKAEFANIVERQIKFGLYEMKKVEKELKDRTDEKGKPITVFATEIVLKDGKPMIAQVSPLTDKYKLTIEQFSVTASDYDPATLKQFAAKKGSFLAAEQSKAEREKEVQERLMIVEKGLRQVAEAKAAGDVKKETAVVAAQLKAEVAIQEKLEAETRANKFLSVAEIAKKEALMTASKKLEVAQINALAALEDKKAMISRAQGRKEAIYLSGDITELEQAIIDAEVAKTTAVAEALAKIKVPTTLFISGGGNGKGNSLMENLINIKLMESTGILDKTNVDRSKVERKIIREAKR